VLTGIVSHNDWFVTLLSAAGEPDIAEKLRTGTDLHGTTYKVHLDGHDQLPYLTGETDESPRQHFFYVSDDGDLTALRYDNWKIVFLEQRCVGTMRIWAEPYTQLRVPLIFNLRTDPYERPRSPRTPTTTGCSRTPTCSSRPRPTSARCCRPSPSSHNGRSRPASASSK